MTKLLQVENLRVSYHTYAGEVQSVRGVTFSLEQGEALAIVGESGCGKTVTAKSIIGLIQSPPGEIKKGSKILFENKDILNFSQREMENYRGCEVSMIFQDPMTSLNPTMRIGRQIAEGLLIHNKISKVEAFSQAVKMLEMVDIPNAERRARQYPHEFSGGMRQRAMIAMALACHPKLLIADEPTTALDVTIQAQIMDLMKDLQKKLNTAIILITHDLGVVAGMAKNVVVMYGGQIVERGTTEEIFYNPQHPYTWALLKSVPRLDNDRKEKLAAIHGTPPDLLAPPKGCPFAARCSCAMRICREMPPLESKLSETHSTSCWLQHVYAPKVDMAKGIGGAVNE